jgi:hypothetical protein
MNIRVEVIHDCKDCEDVGAVVSNDPQGNIEIQRCDACAVYDGDDEPQKYFEKKWCEIKEWYYPSVKGGIHLTKYPGSKKWQLKKEDA